ncbi:MAG: isopeptide-forming domain-containing fimbrial protein [Clostridia bacterium]|nr:isopeptide-forming domain-containing fimbrial protein [Clostridia bacterium]
MKKFATILLTLVMILSLTTIASAADTTISVAAGDTRTYAVYQIFKGDLSDGTLSNVVWGKNGTGTENAAVPQTTLDELVALNGSSETAKLAKINTLVNTSSDPIGTVSDDAPLTVATGYYYIVDQGEVGSGEAYSLNLVNVVGPTTITPKVGEVTSYKKVDDKNDSTRTEDAVEWKDSADYDIGDQVPFQLTGTVPADYANYTTYEYCFHDKEEAGLTFNPDSVKVYVDSNLISDGYVVKTTGLTDDCTFEVYFANLKTIDAVKAGSTITVEYTSELNASANIGSAGNKNTMYLEYSNNPNTTGKGTTAPDTVVVFTYQVIVNKVDSQRNPLAGAEFTLYKKNASGVYAAIGTAQAGTAPAGSEVANQFTWKGLDDGEYKISETKTPEGFNTMADLEFTVTATHTLEWTDDGTSALTALNGGNLGTGEVSTGAVTGEIINNRGTVLPETGAEGTMMLVVLGSTMAMIAAIFMVTRKKMSIYED